jgi:hypothetical protein
MSQRGQSPAREGWDCAAILANYYPGTETRRRVTFPPEYDTIFPKGERNMKLTSLCYIQRGDQYLNAAPDGKRK